MMKISNTVQNQTAIYIFSLMIFCESTHKPLWYCPPPAAPTLGTEQLTSSGNVVQKGLIDTACWSGVILSTVWFLFNFLSHKNLNLDSRIWIRVSVQGVKSLGGHFACLYRGFDFYEVKKIFLFFKKKKGNTFILLIIFIVKSL